MGFARGIRLVGRSGLALLLCLAWASLAQAQVGFIQVAPGLQRSVCTDITNPVANQSWCGNGNPPYSWEVWNGTQWVLIGGGGGAGNPAPPDTSVQFNNGGVFGGDSLFLWDNTLKRAQIGTLPLGPLAPGPLVVGLVAPTGTGMQAGLFQTTTGTNAGQGLVTLGSDNVAVSGWAFRGADGSNPLYGGNFGVHFLGPGQVRGVEIDVQNEFADAGIGAFGNDVGLWLNRSGVFNSSSAIEISSQDPRGWWYGIHFDPGAAGTGTSPLIKGWGIYAFRAMPDHYIGFVPSDDLNPDNDILDVFAFDGTTKKAAIVKRGRFMGRGDSTGVTNPTFSFVDDPTTGVYTAAPSQVGLGVMGLEIFKAVAEGTVTTGYEESVGTTFANLGTPAAPALIWCSDCQATDPCTGGGAGGAWAFRVASNTSWSCTGGGGAPITGPSCAFGGRVIIADTATTGSVTFGTALSDAIYAVTLGTATASGTPPAVAARYTSPTTAGFTVELTAPPGGGNSVAVSYLVSPSTCSQTPVGGGIGGNGTANQVAYWDSSSTITGSAAFTVNAGTATLSLGTASATTGVLAFLNATNANVTGLKAGVAAASVTYTLPTNDGAAGTCLSTNGSGVFGWANCSSGGTGLTSLNGQTGSTQTFAKVDDTNVTLAINSATDVHTFTMGWTGTLAPVRGGTGLDTSGSTGVALVTAGVWSVGPLTGDVTTINNVTTINTTFKVKECVVILGDPGAASPVLTDDNDSPVACPNDFGSDWTITTVACWANAGSPTVTPILTGGSGTSILTGALTCGTAAWAAGTVNGSPVVHAFSGAGATCSSTPCSADVNITTAGGTAKYVVVKIAGTLP